MSFIMDLPILVIIGMVVTYIAHKVLKDKPRGGELTRLAVYVLGAFIVGSIILVSIGLYLDWYGIGGTKGSDFMLNSFIPILHFQRSPLVDLIAAFLFLMYPVAFLFGAGVMARRIGVGLLPIIEPLKLPSKKSIIVIADTHLGMRRGAFQRILDFGPECEPAVVGSFLDWLSSLNSEESSYSEMNTNVASLRTLLVWDRMQGKVLERPIHPPEHVVLLGDILEMWDSQEESVQFMMATTFTKLNRQQADVVYVVGNHDHVFERDQSTASVGGGEIRVVPEVWPGPDLSDNVDKKGQGMRPIRAGKRDYLFIHGHQFDAGFQTFGPLTLIPGHLRRAARLGHYVWLFGLLFVLALYIWFRGTFAGFEALALLVVVSLFLLVLPMLYMTLGRSLWRSIGGGRYHRKRAQKGFVKWWKTRIGGGRGPASKEQEDLTVVYGHTHVSDIIDEKRASRLKWLEGLTERREMPLLLNIPAWTKDPRRDVERAIFLYADAGGYLFFGWDWKEKKPFHIPDELIHARREGRKMSSALSNAHMTKNDLRSLNWPKAFIEKWTGLLSDSKLPP